MSYRIRIEQPALKEIKALPSYVRAQAEILIAALSSDPRPQRSRELQGKPGVYRLWLAGRWRIVYEVIDDSRVVYIIRVRRKEQVDYESNTSRTQPDE